MDAADLKVFEAVARHGSMNRAAAELNAVQSNVTARVRALSSSLASFYSSGMHAAYSSWAPYAPLFGTRIQAA
jgi:hypothetical protein